MSNYRIVFDNAFRRAAVAASAAASASLGVSNLLNDIKGLPYRSASNVATLTLTWAKAELIGAIAAMPTSCGVQTTIRVQCYTETNDATPIYDSGNVLGCPEVPVGLRTWGSDALGVNAYSYGGSSCVRHWLPQHVSCKKVVITITDSAAAYVEFSMFVAGRYMEGKRNVDYGISLTAVDTSLQSRNEPGDLITEVRPKHRSLSFNLSNMEASERHVLWNIFWGNGLALPMFVSVFPGDVDTTLEQSHQIYAKLVKSAAMAIPSYRQFATSLDLEEV